MMRRRRRARDGYAMVMVVLFLLLFLGLWGQAARQVGSMIRIEEARARRARKDADRLPAMMALARGLSALESGYPPASPYVCSHQNADGSLFALTFLNDPDRPGDWTVSVEPTADTSLPVLDPGSFLTSPPAS